MPGVGLGEAGRLQGAALARRFAGRGLAAVYTSPVQRARETAAFLAAAPQVSEALEEIDFGAWTGKAFTRLAADPDWARWNSRRSEARAPCGETMAEVQHRVTCEIDSLALRHDGACVAAVSHGDVIKAALMFYLGMGLDDWWRFEISPASVSVLSVERAGTRVLSMNETDDA